MMFHDAKVYGPYGAVPAKDIKVGDPVWSWEGRWWRRNRIAEVKRGQSKTAFTIFSFDGEVPMHLRCSVGQLFRITRQKNIQSESVRTGQAVLASQGAHVFRAQVGAVIAETLSEPEDTYDFVLRRGPRNILVDGFLCRA